VSAIRLLINAAIFLSLCCASIAQNITTSNIQVSRTSAQSGLEWTETANPNHYFDAIGQKGAVLGRQDGRFEAWIWPIKVLHGFRLEFQLDDMAEAVRGEHYLQSVTVRPESTTLLYVHPSFTVKQTIWAADDQPAIIQYFDVTSDRPLTIKAKFVPDFKPMWPAAMGGQHTNWVPELKAFTLSDGTETPTALIGAPATGAHTEFVDHSLITGEMLLQIATTPDGTKRGSYPLVITLDMGGEKAARATYQYVLDHARDMYEAKAQRWREFLANTLTIHTPDDEFNRAFTWAKVSIQQGWSCTAPPSAATPANPHPSVPPEGFAFPGEEKCGLVAGYGPSVDGERPGFAWWFGGDGMVSSWAMLDYGDEAGTLQELRFLRAHQRADGKMMHEMAQSTGVVDWWKNYHFSYMHADTTAMYLYSLGEYWRRTGDRQFLADFWPSIQKAYAYCLSTLDSDGLVDNTKSGLGAIEGGLLRGKVTKDIYVEGFWLGGLRAYAELAGAHGDSAAKQDAEQRLATALTTLRTKWRDARGGYAFGVNTEGQQSDILGNWSAALMSLGGGVGPTAADDAKAVEAFALPELSTDWGSRGISNRSPYYDPVSYSNGSVWPYGTGFVGWAQYHNASPLQGFQTLITGATVIGEQAPGGMPEHLVGNRNEPGGPSIPHQLFSSWSMLRPVITGMFGIGRQYDALAGSMVYEFAPALPAAWPLVKFHGRDLDTTVALTADRLSIGFDFSGQPLPIHFAPTLPYDSTVSRVLVNGSPAKFEVTGGDLKCVHFTAPASKNVRAEIITEGGINIVPIAPKPERGASNSTMKILAVHITRPGHALELRLAGLSGQIYPLELVTSRPALAASGASVKRALSGYTLSIPFEPGDGYVEKTVTLSY